MKVWGLLVLLSAPSAFAVDARLVTLETGVQVIQSPEHTYYTGYRPELKPATMRGLGETHVVLNDCANLPDEFDLRDIPNVVPATRDQGHCGSCWAFSKTASLSSANAANGGSSLVLAEQQLVSCDTAEMGCQGGLLDGFGYQIQHGQALDKDFPYTATDGSCTDGLKPAAQGATYVNVGTTDSKATIDQIQCALYKSHTIPWIVVAASKAWSTPPTDDNAVYTACARGQVNHAVGVVGWKTIGGQVYLKMRNSWGNAWGSTAGRPGMEKGYMMMPLGCDNLGDEVAYIQTKAQGCMAPTVRLPAEITIARGAEAKLSVPSVEAGVDYQWLQGKANLTTGDSAMVAPATDTVYKVVAKNACGTAESQVRVKVMTN